MGKHLTDTGIALVLMGFVPGHQIHEVVEAADRVVEHFDPSGNFEWTASVREALANASADEAVAICEAIAWGEGAAHAGTFHVEAEGLGWAA